MHVSMNRIDNKYIEAICYFDSKYRFISGDERYFAMMGEVVESQPQPSSWRICRM